MVVKAHAWLRKEIGREMICMIAAGSSWTLMANNWIINCGADSRTASKIKAKLTKIKETKPLLNVYLCSDGVFGSSQASRVGDLTILPVKFPHTILKQIRFPNGNPLFLSLFSLSKNWMHNVVWGCAEVLPYFLSGFLLNYDFVDEGLMLETSAFLLFETKLPTMILILLVSSL